MPAERPDPTVTAMSGACGIAAHAHPSWLDFLPEALVGRARASTLGLRVLARLLDRNYCLGSDRNAAESPAHAWTRASPARQVDAALAIGAAALAPLVRQAIDGRQVRELRLAFGAVPHGSATTEPPVAAEPLPVDRWEACTNADQYRQLAIGVGLTMMLDALRPEAPHMARRLQLLFSKNSREAFGRRPQPTDRAALHAALAKLCLGDD